MPEHAAYDLLILLDPEAPEERREELVQQVKSQINSGGATLKGDADWGMRKLSYEIDHRREAQYHLFQFEAAPELLGQLDRSLSIDDSVLRHRIIRLPGDAPEATPRPSEDIHRRQPDERGGQRGEERTRGDESAPEPGEAGEQAVEAGEQAVEAGEQAVEAAAETPAAEGSASEPPPQEGDEGA